jgi:DNA (cytosine-5)-methyltransferase 1
MGKDGKYFVDLFAGCGGLSLGLEQAGFVPAYVNELDKDAMESYLINREEFPLLREKYSSNDIQQITKNGELEKLQSGFEEDYGIKRGELALVVGGPPCQGYSAIGIRRNHPVDRKRIPSNYLFKDMIKVIDSLQPRAFLFENVMGLMTGRWMPQGTKGEIWDQVTRAFAKLDGYTVGWTKSALHAKHYGVPQNRPRIFIMGIKGGTEPKLLDNGGLWPTPTNGAPDPVDLFSDLVDPEYRQELKTPRYLSDPQSGIQKILRTKPDGSILSEGNELAEQEYSNHSAEIRAKFQYMIDNGGKITEAMKTKKFAQRVIPERWGEKGPNITATSLPDDYVHYCQPRSLTVREWARLQMFPDWYKFAGKRTTGGDRRAGNPSKGDWSREAPKYTQIGNAVPVKLAEEIGKHIKKLIQ